MYRLVNGRIESAVKSGKDLSFYLSFWRGDKRRDIGRPSHYWSSAVVSSRFLLYYWASPCSTTRKRKLSGRGGGLELQRFFFNVGRSENKTTTHKFGEHFSLFHSCRRKPSLCAQRLSGARESWHSVSPPSVVFARALRRLTLARGFQQCKLCNAKGLVFWMCDRPLQMLWIHPCKLLNYTESCEWEYILRLISYFFATAQQTFGE